MIDIVVMETHHNQIAAARLFLSLFLELFLASLTESMFDGPYLVPTIKFMC